MKRHQKFLHAIMTTTALVVVFVFALFWFRPSNVPNNFHGWGRLGDLFLYLTLTYIIWQPIVMKMLTWAIASHIKNVSNPIPKPGLKVAFVTTFVPASESVSLLHKTLPAMVAANYTHDTWLLDEGNDPEVQEICEQYGVYHFSRYGKDLYNAADGKFARKTKGGNHNSWYDTVGNSYDIVAQMDTDFIPHPNFLTKTLGHFNDPKVAFVGTPQIYGNTKESLIARGAAEQTYSFYGPLLRGMDGMETTMLIGANHVMRVAALKSVDHYSAHITEDLLTGMKLHAKGWKSVYIPEALAIGEGPTNWKAYFNQQKRWAYGCMHILFNHSFRLFRGMSTRRTLYYFLIQQHYFSGIATALSVVCLGLYFGFGLLSADINLETFLSFYIPLLIVLGMMSFWLQRFNIRPKKERGVMWAGMYIGIAAWPIFFIAFLSLFKRKKLVYKVTPKGKKTRNKNTPYRLFVPHMAIGTISLVGFGSSFITHRQSSIMVFWSVVGGLSMLLIPIVPALLSGIIGIVMRIRRTALAINNQYKFFELDAADKGALPTPPSDDEKYLYSKRRINYLLLFSVVSFGCATISMASFLFNYTILWTLYLILGFNVAYFFVSLIVNLFTKDFDLDAHKQLIASWSPATYPSVDIFLPTAGEALNVLQNTWDGIQELRQHYKGAVRVYCLDDSAREQVAELAANYGFRYEVRPDRGYFKKAGNLRHGYRISNSEFIAIFDADFVPRSDFLDELLPYFTNSKVGIVQSPQYFDVSSNQNWLERGAGAVQELFYRFSQVSRQNNDASICVGSNAVYRRRALQDTGGTALIEHSEDVHTGFNLRMKGWTIQYLPVIVAKGLCPASMPAFFKQQYRWCMGSMSLLSSAKFWQTRLKFRSRMAYMSGFCYYINTGLMSIYTPLVPLILLIALPEQVNLINYALVLPSVLFTQIIYPLWHKSTYGIEAWATRLVYGWAHLFAISDAITNKPMQWQPTGAKVKKDQRYISFRTLQIFFNFIPGLLWVGLASYHVIYTNHRAFLPILLSGMYYLAVSAKVTFYFVRPIRVTQHTTDAVSAPET